jgi:HPt (histidine-containing phosphotransfer) domain-containing protein
VLTSAYKLFLSELKKHGDAISACAPLRVATDLNHIAHAAKGDARNAGAVNLGDLLQALEQAATSNDWQRVDALVPAILAEQATVADFIRHHVLPGAPA